MPRGGRRRVATQAEVAAIRKFAREGASRREIAEIVFGDSRYHGRVDRILREPGAYDEPKPAPDDAVEADGGPRERDDPLAFFRELLNRHRERLAQTDGPLPSLKEIELLMKLERQLATAESVERLNALTRRDTPSARGREADDSAWATPRPPRRPHGCCHCGFRIRGVRSGGGGLARPQSRGVRSSAGVRSQERG
jgi:hypothetical protein